MYALHSYEQWNDFLIRTCFFSLYPPLGNKFNANRKAQMIVRISVVLVSGIPIGRKWYDREIAVLGFSSCYSVHIIDSDHHRAVRGGFQSMNLCPPLFVCRDDWLSSRVLIRALTTSKTQNVCFVCSYQRRAETRFDFCSLQWCFVSIIFQARSTDESNLSLNAQQFITSDFVGW